MLKIRIGLNEKIQLFKVSYSEMKRFLKIGLFLK